MQKKILFILILGFMIISGSSYSQLPNVNMHLIKNLSPHAGSGGQFDYSALWGYVAPNGREYVIMGCYNGTSFIDITDSANVHEVGYLPAQGAGSIWREEKVIGHYAYIVSEAANSKMQIVDLQYLPDSIHYVKTTAFPLHSSTHSIQSYADRYLLLNGCNSSFVQAGGVIVVDCINPENPVLRGKGFAAIGGNTNGYVHDCRVIDDTLYACNIYTGYVTEYDIRNKDSLKAFKSWQTTPNPFTHNCAMSIDKKYLFTTDETTSPNGKLKVWNIQDRLNPVFVTSWQPTGITTATVHNVEVYGNYALIAHYAAGVRLVDITNPAAPNEVAWWDTNPATNSSTEDGDWACFMFPSKKIVASDMKFGLFVVKPNTAITGIGYDEPNAFPSEYTLKQNYPNPFNPATQIEFSIPTNSFVTLKVYNMAGKEISTLVNDTRDRGTYRISFDGSKLASGTYFYSLTTADHSETKKMILVK